MTANLVVESLDDAQRHLVLGIAISSDSIPMSINHVGEFFKGFEPLPRQARAPAQQRTGSGLAYCLPPFFFSC